MSNAALLSHFPRSIRLIVVWLVPSRRATSYCESPICLRIALNCAAKLSWRLTSGTTLSDTSSSSEMPNTSPRQDASSSLEASDVSESTTDSEVTIDFGSTPRSVKKSSGSVSSRAPIA